MELRDSVVIVTGASSGIGEYTARRLADEGAKLVLAARNADKLEKLAAELPESVAIATDMMDSSAIERMVAQTIDEFGRVDVLMNNAGQGMRCPVADIKLEDIRYLLELNVVAQVAAMQQVIPHMRRQGGGMILNISSMLSTMNMPKLAGYACTKHALNNISRSARQELAADNIRVCLFLPRITGTDFGMNTRGSDQYDSRKGAPGMSVDPVEDVADAIVAQIRSEEEEVRRSY
ncbi:MAG: SDR family NAD(P)-dependent oxidoreductase [Planctomycetales bacterium]|nr:SDR family NAD(P)-dependent oxidoreductase [bacterium]UNM07804.1 MAG: SDR family NAD(P)-dependent oxidoreductase [Planctomycetales bacterium]